MLEDLDFVARQLFALRRHLVLAGVLDGGNERACDVAGFHDFSAGAALEGSREGGQVEAAFGLVRVVAIQAGLLENGKNVVVVGSLLLGPGGGREDDEDDEQALHWEIGTIKVPTPYERPSCRSNADFGEIIAMGLLGACHQYRTDL